jgi:hypothetical protein
MSGLDLGRNGACEGNSWDVYQLAHLLKANLRLATRDHCGYRLAGRRSSNLAGFAADLICHSEPRKQRGVR